MRALDRTSARPSGASAFALVRPLPVGASRISGGLLFERMQTNRRVSLAYGLDQLEAGGNIRNLQAVADDGLRHHPTLTLDADVYKWLEAAAWELGRGDDADLTASFDRVVQIVLDGQESNGYLNSWFQVMEPDRKLSDLTRGCEMYCAGHLIEAGVAMHAASGDVRLLDAGRRFADLLESRFGERGRDGIDGHEEIELALVALYRATRQSRYLDLARRFIDQRGHGLVGPGVFGPRYYQDHEPVREADTITGHAVRAMYLATGAADVYLEEGDRTLLDALERQWDSMVTSKMYLTGGLGSRERDEAIGEPYELAPDRAYCETCAAAGLIFWNWRMLQATGDSRYADLLERTLYNAFLTGVSLDGRSYFYANPLETRAENEAPHESEWSGETPWYISPAPEQATAGRRDWFPCACCPPNVMRVLSSLDNYVATSSDDGIQIQLFAEGSISVALPDGVVSLQVSTDYPWDGKVRVRVESSPGTRWRLSLRIPAWASGATVTVADEREQAQPGYWECDRDWRSGDEVLLSLPMAPRFTQPMPRASAVYGTLAVERGPLVYCVEQADNPGINLADLRVGRDAALSDTAEPELTAGSVAVRLRASVAPPPDEPWAYAQAVGAGETDAPDAPEQRDVTAIPYFAWSNRGANAMRVWLPTSR